jgi:uncharacterized protein (DUF952 family)
VGTRHGVTGTTLLRLRDVLAPGFRVPQCHTLSDTQLACRRWCKASRLDIPAAVVDLGAADGALYKICPRPSWSDARALGRLPTSRDDARDGYVHLSTAGQVRGTLARHFAGQQELLLLVLPRERLPDGTLRWEAARNGELFPHLYAELTVELVAEVIELPLDADQRHVLPQGF